MPPHPTFLTGLYERIQFRCLSSLQPGMFLAVGLLSITGAAAPAPCDSFPPDSVRIVGVGDIMMGSDWPKPYLDERMRPGGNPAETIGVDLLELLRSGDVTFGNFEGTLHASDEGAKTCSNPAVCYTFRSPLWHAEYLRAAGFTMLSNANNHARDFGEKGRAATYRHLTEAGFAVSSGDSDLTRFGLQRLKDGTRVVLVAFGHNPGLMRVQQLPRGTELVRAAGARADIVVVSCHIGAEGSSFERLTRAPEKFLEEDRGDPMAFARRAVDAGADVVLCHGPHVPRAIEVYKGRFIAYSLGNFWTFGRFNLQGINGLVPVVDLVVARDGTLRRARIVSAAQTAPGGPRLDFSGAARELINRQSVRDIPEAGITIGVDGEVRWPEE